MMVNTERLKKRMKELGVKQHDAAEALHITQGNLSMKLDNKRPFDLDEAITLAKLLKIEKEFFDYFS